MTIFLSIIAIIYVFGVGYTYRDTYKDHKFGGNFRFSTSVALLWPFIILLSYLPKFVDTVKRFL